MNIGFAVNDNRSGTSGFASGLEEAPAAFYRLGEIGTMVAGAEPNAVQAVVAAAVLATAAFRMRDEEGVSLGLRRLVDAIDGLEVEQKAA